MGPDVGDEVVAGAAGDGIHPTYVWGSQGPEKPRDLRGSPIVTDTCRVLDRNVCMAAW